MDAPNPSAQPSFATRTPLHVGAVGLIVSDLDRVLGFYRDVLGLSVIDRTADAARLGAGGVVFVELQHQPGAKPDDTREAGLYHTAFVMPTRADLARWVLHIARSRYPITGASDHAVSEAFYLDDPEGNGVEVYADRPPQTWVWTGDFVRITTDPLDIDDILREVDPATATYPAAPDGLRIGHIHLRVGNVEVAEHFYRDAIGLAVMREGRSGATFLSSGRYHHHVAGNIWHSRGAGPRDPDRAGLAWFSLEASDGTVFDQTERRLQMAGVPLTDRPAELETSDPWGTRIRLVKA